MVLGLIGNIAGNLDQDAFVAGAENESKLQALQRANQNRINRDFFRDQQGGPPAIPMPTALNQGMAGLSLDGFGGEYITVPDPNLDMDGGVSQGIDEADKFYQDKILRDQERMQQGQLNTPPVVPEFDSSKTVINPSDNQNLPNDQIPLPEFTNPDLSALFPEGVVSENDVSDEEKESLHVQGFPWKVVDKNGGKIVVHNGVEYNIKDVFGDGSSLMLVDRFDRPNQVLTDAFTKARARGITNTEIVPRTSSSQDDLAAATVDNSFISNALKSIKENKFQNESTQSAVNFARIFGINEGEALGLLAVESNFGNVGDRKKSKSKGPLQIQSLAYKDIKSFYKGNNPANSGLTDVQWNQMVDIVNNLPKNHANLTNNSDQIAAGLLYYKMIGLKGVDPKFQAAAYYDGYTKYIGINDISDIKNFAGPNTLQSVTKYNSAVLGMKDYLGQVSNYYYPVGGASTAAANNQNTQTTTSSAVTNNQTSGQTTVANNNQVASNNQIAGLKTEDASTDTSAQSANTGNQGTASKDVSSLQIQSGVDTGGKKTEETVPKADPVVKPPAFYTNDPSKLGFDLRNYLEERSLIINQTNQNVQILAQRSEYFRRLAEVSRIGGTDEASYNQLINNSTELMAKAQTMQQAGALEAKKAENKIMYLQGMQGLQDLANGSVNRAAAVWSQYSGMDIRINPRSDGKYDVTLNGKPYKTYDLKTLSETLQLAFDQGYRKSQQSAATTRGLKTFEAQLEILKDNYKSLNTRQEKLLQGKIDILKKREEQQGDIELKVDTNSGVVYIQRGSEFFMLEVGQDTTLDGKTVDVVREVRVQPPANLTPSGNAYKREKK
jgi:hypothetical protein